MQDLNEIKNASHSFTTFMHVHKYFIKLTCFTRSYQASVFNKPGLAKGLHAHNELL